MTKSAVCACLQSAISLPNEHLLMQPETKDTQPIFVLMGRDKKNDKLKALGVMTGASVLKGSPRPQLQSCNMPQQP